LEITCKNDDIPFHAQGNHIRCIAHVMNRVVGDILKEVKIGAIQGEDELPEDEEEENHDDDLSIMEVVLKVS